MMKLTIAALTTALVLSGCGTVNKQSAGQLSSPAAVKQAPPEPIQLPRPTEGLSAIKNKLTEHGEELRQKHSIQIQMVGAGKDHILMQIRRIGVVEGEIPEEELASIKKTLYDIAGEEFPLKLSVWQCCKGEPQVTGKIKSLDPTRGTILVVNEQKKNGDSDDPEATYISLQPDGLLIVQGTKVSSGFSKELVGREAKVWTTGLMLQSYPGQATALKVVVE